MKTSSPSLLELSRQLRQGAVQPRQLVEACIAAYERCESQVHAWVAFDPERALKAADVLSRRKPGVDQPLWGIPFGIKDIIEVSGFPTRCGSRLRNDSLATEDAAVVEKLRAAGAIFLGKTVTTEWACFDPPVTKNPWNLERTPGGSSSGSAAAVATGMCLAALGTQTGGSIIRPAAYCGVAGLKPGHQAWMLSGVAPVSPTLDHVGPIAKSAADLKLIWSVLSDDGFIDDSQWLDDEEFEAQLVSTLAIVEDAFLSQIDPDVRSLFERSLGKLQQQFNLEAYVLPQTFEQIHRHHRTIMAAEAAAVHSQAFEKSPELFGPEVSSLIEEGLRVTAVRYLAARDQQVRLGNEVLQMWPDGALLTLPATVTAAPGCETTGDPRLNSPWSFLGIPAVTIPLGLNEAGLPIGLQLVGLDEQELLETAISCERLLAAGLVCPRG